MKGSIKWGSEYVGTEVKTAELANPVPAGFPGEPSITPGINMEGVTSPRGSECSPWRQEDTAHSDLGISVGSQVLTVPLANFKQEENSNLAA